MKIPFNKPFKSGQEMEHVKIVLDSDNISGNAEYTEKCHVYLKKLYAADSVFLTQSATSGLEMAMILANVGPGDEVILPSFTFSSCATAIARQGAVPVFVDVDFDTKNVNAEYLAQGLSKKTKVVMPVHYAGNPCDLDEILDFAKSENLVVVEDAAQAVGASYKNRALGTFGDFAALSFHETKNITCGEGGTLLVNNPIFTDRAEIIWEKGTNRKQFFRGEIDKYSWIDIGSSFLPSEITAAILWAQLDQIENVTADRIKTWNQYYEKLKPLEDREILQLPRLNPHGVHNGHIFYVTLQTKSVRDRVLAQLKEKGIQSTFHYIPLHSSVAGKKFGRYAGDMKNTETVSDTLLRLPMYFGFDQVDYVTTALEDCFKDR